YMTPSIFLVPTAVSTFYVGFFSRLMVHILAYYSRGPTYMTAITHILSWPRSSSSGAAIIAGTNVSHVIISLSFSWMRGITMLPRRGNASSPTSHQQRSSLTPVPPCGQTARSSVETEFITTDTLAQCFWDLSHQLR